MIYIYESYLFYLQREYEKDNNPRHVWNAIYLLGEGKTMEYPKWVRSYLEATAMSLLKRCNRKKTGKEGLAFCLGFKKLSQLYEEDHLEIEKITNDVDEKIFGGKKTSISKAATAVAASLEDLGLHHDRESDKDLKGRKPRQKGYRGSYKIKKLHQEEKNKLRSILDFFGLIPQEGETLRAQRFRLEKETDNLYNIATAKEKAKEKAREQRERAIEIAEKAVCYATMEITQAVKATPQIKGTKTEDEYSKTMNDAYDVISIWYHAKLQCREKRMTKKSKPLKINRKKTSPQILMNGLCHIMEQQTALLNKQICKFEGIKTIEELVENSAEILMLKKELEETIAYIKEYL